MNGGTWEHIDVSSWPRVQTEVAGSNEPNWLAEPGTKPVVLWLHKDTCIPENGIEQGEDWAEVIAIQVAKRLGVPCAETRLCSLNGRRGSISRSVKPRDADLNEGGAVLESACAPGYLRQTDGVKACDPERPEVRRPGHNLANIKEVLLRVSPPDGFEGPAECSGFDVFTGLMILDALIANQDRHEQNWAVLRSKLSDACDRLSPSYDHGRSLGSSLQDSKRARIAADDDELAKWAARGAARRFEHILKGAEGLYPGVPLCKSLIQHAAEAVSLCSPAAAKWWREQVRTLDLAPLYASLRCLSYTVGTEVVSVDTAKFVTRLLEHNLGRLRDAICNSS